eukprot:jgi/Antlo1/1693/2414
MISSLIVDKALWFFSLVGAAAYVVFINVAVGFDSIVQTSSYNEFFLPTLITVFSLTTFLSMFSAGTKCILFVYSEKPDCVEKTLPEVHAAARKVKEGSK